MIKKRNISLLIIIFFSSITSICALNTSVANIYEIYPNRKKDINQDIDLKGGTLLLPEGVILNFKGGIIKNGTIIGNNTQINSKTLAFDNIIIKGDWDIPIIYSNWFKDINKENALKNVIALTNPNVKNKVIITKGEYWLSVFKERQSCLVINSNTEISISGTIRLKSNSFKYYDIFHIKGHNVYIKGKGMIIGDKFKHMGTTGEWGMGIRVSQSSNVKVSGLTISACWGDCVYIGGNSKNIIIEKCYLDNGRRQGISVTSGDNIILRDIIIKDIGGTAPEYAIDVEPNSNETIGNVLIEKVKVFNCKGGFTVYGAANGANVKKVVMNNNLISGTVKIPINILKCKKLVVINNQIEAFETDKGISCVNVDDVILTNNKIKIKRGIFDKIKNTMLLVDYMKISKCKTIVNNKNKIVNE